MRRVSKVRAWLRARPMVTDTFWALVVGGLSLLMLQDPVFVTADVPGWFVVVWLLGGSALPLVWRRTRPDAAMAVVALGCVMQLFITDMLGPNNIAVAMMLYAVAAYGRREWAPRWLLIAFVGLVLAAVDLTVNQTMMSPEAQRWMNFVIQVIVYTAIVAACWFPGMLARNRRDIIETLRERAESLERERDSSSRLAAQEERNRIAREMHDIVAHSLSVIVVQADGASYALAHGDPGTSPAVAAKTLDTIGETARAALTETRRLVGVLRQDDDETDYAPQAGLAHIEELVQRVNDSGVPCELSVSGDPSVHAEPSAAVDMCVYRVVQEALTNTMKHGGHRPSATVEIGHHPDRIDVAVRDTGRGPQDEDGLGHGIIGMRERITSLGGEFVARPRPGGGFEVLATVPVNPA